LLCPVATNQPTSLSIITGLLAKANKIVTGKDTLIRCLPAVKRPARPFRLSSKYRMETANVNSRETFITRDFSFQLAGEEGARIGHSHDWKFEKWDTRGAVDAEDEAFCREKRAATMTH
jgi:hypothetical protein